MVQGENEKTLAKGTPWFLVSSVVLLVGAVGAGTVAYQNRLTAGQWALGEAVRYFGFAETRFTLSRLETDGATLDDIRLGPDVRIGRTEISYTLKNLIRGRIGRVTASDLDLDISQPDQGFLGKIRKFTTAGTSKTPTGPPQHLPTISLKDMRIHGGIENAVLELTINADLNPDLSGNFSAVGTTSYQLPGRRLRVGNLSVSGQLDSGGSAVRLALESGDITDDAPANWFPPLGVSGKGTYSDTKTDFSLVLNDHKKRFSASLTGHANIAARSATASITLPVITFSEGGLQPDDLTALARLPVPVNASVGGTAEVTWRQGEPEVKTDIRISGGGLAFEETSVKGLQARITANWPTVDQRAKISVHIPHAVVRHGGRPFRLKSVAATVRLDPATGRLTWALPLLRLRHMAAKPLFSPLRLRGRGDFTNGHLGFELSAFLDKPELAHKLLTVTGHHDLADARGQATLIIPDLAFAPGSLEPADIAASLDLSQKVTGRISGHSAVSWIGSKITTSGGVKISDLTIATDTLSVDKINADLRLSSLWPPRTASPQTIHAERISSAITFETPNIRFSIPETADSKSPILLIHKLEAGFIGGNLSISNMRADPGADTHHFTLDLSHLDLAQVFALIELEGISGTGQLSGKIPLSITNDDIVVTDGLLSSDAPGVLRFRSDQAKQALAGGGEQVELLLRVLNDFRYEKLALTLGRESSGSTHLGLHLGGHNPAVMKGHAFNLNINVEGNVDRLLETLMEGYRLSDRALRATVGAGQ